MKLPQFTSATMTSGFSNWQVVLSSPQTYSLLLPPYCPFYPPHSVRWHLRPALHSTVHARASTDFYSLLLSPMGTFLQTATSRILLEKRAFKDLPVTQKSLLSWDKQQSRCAFPTVIPYNISSQKQTKKQTLLYIKKKVKCLSFCPIFNFKKKLTQYIYIHSMGRGCPLSPNVKGFLLLSVTILL